MLLIDGIKLSGYFFQILITMLAVEANPHSHAGINFQHMLHRIVGKWEEFDRHTVIVAQQVRITQSHRIVV